MYLNKTIKITEEVKRFESPSNGVVTWRDKYNATYRI